LKFISEQFNFDNYRIVQIVSAHLLHTASSAPKSLPVIKACKAAQLTRESLSLTASISTSQAASQSAKLVKIKAPSRGLKTPYLQRGFSK